MHEATPATIKVTSTVNSNRYKALEEEGPKTPQPPTATQFKEATQKFISNILTMKQPQGTKRLDAKEIQELIQANVTRYSQKERVELAIRLRDQMKQLPQSTPVAIPDPATVINKASLMAMEHNTHLEVLDKLVPTSMWGTPKHTALLIEMDIDAITIRKRNSIQVPFELRHFKGTSQETALLDTEATESFIDIKTVKRLNLGSQELDNP